MGQHLAKLIPAVLVGGCSLIYNPNNIDRPPIDAKPNDIGETPVDVEIRADASPANLELTEAFPPTIYEGSGVMSRKAVVVVRGKQIVAGNNVVVTLTPGTAGAVTLDSFEVAGNGDYIALLITAPITTCADTESVAVVIKVEQDNGMGGRVMAELPSALAVTCLNELIAAPASASDLKAMYSKIEIAGPLNFPAAAAPSALLRSASFISIGGAVDASATGRDPGPGGALGGIAATNGAGPRFGSTGASGGGAGGGGAGFVVAGAAGDVGTLGSPGGIAGGTIGDIWIAQFSANASSGGGGGAGTLTSTGGTGGGGGGVLELTAPGDISIGAITANGAAGAAGGGGDGGAGTGGVVVVRTGNMLDATTVSVAKGVQTGFGASSDGRVRVDAAKGPYPTGPTLCSVPFAAGCNLTRGPMFIDPPSKTTNQMHALMLRGTPDDNTSTLRVDDKAGNPVGGVTYTPVFGSSGTAMLNPVLKAGYNKVCVWVQGGAPSVLESKNCVEIAYLPL